MRVDLLVTGGTGLLGSALKQLYPDATFVGSHDCDLRDITQVRTLFERLRPARVLHLAASVGGVKSNAQRNAELFAENMQINVNVLSVAHEFQVSRLISILASCAFAIYIDRSTSEGDLHVGMPFEGNLGYGCSKRMLDVYTKLLWRQYGCKFSTITPVTMYGPHDNFSLEDGHVIGALIHKAVLSKESGGALEVWGSGDAIRQFVYVKDVARILLHELDAFDGPETVIVAPDAGIKISELVRLITRAADYTGPVLFDQGKPQGVLIRRLESKRFEEKFSGFKFTPMEAGLAETVAWFLKNASVINISGVTYH